ncbi:vpr [Scenedesmus sp. PABB004]|nr:vpr [Scenedesmus sp. PABB004]
MRPAVALALLVAALALAAPAVGGKLRAAAPGARVVPRRFIVQLTERHGRRLAGAGDAEAPAARRARRAGAGAPSPFLRDARAANVNVTQLRSYDGPLFRGVALAAGSDGDAAALLERLDADAGVAAVFPVTTITAPRPVRPSPRRVPGAAAAAAIAVAASAAAASPDALGAGAGPDAAGAAVAPASFTQTPLPIPYPDVTLPLGPGGAAVAFRPSRAWGVADALTNVTALRERWGLTGAGVRIGIIDSGIDYTHPAFGRCTAVGQPAGRCRVVAGWDFVGDGFEAPTDAPQPNDDPMDCGEERHGTSVAGVAAAGYVEGAPMLGVAPEALLGAYQVYGCSGVGTSEALLAALEAAVDDGMDIVNLSLGEPSGYTAEPWAGIMAALFARGVVVVRTPGNEGDPWGGQGLFYADGHTAPGALVVGGSTTASDDFNYVGPSAFSSWGPDPELRLLPTVTGPAEMLITTYGGGGRYTTPAFRDGGAPLAPVSGTSFAAPYAAGALALALQLHRAAAAPGAGPDAPALASLPPPVGLLAGGAGGAAAPAPPRFDQAWVNAALSATARPLDANMMFVEESVAKQGAGLFDIGAAVLNPISLDPPSLGLPSEGSTHVANVTLTYAAQPTDTGPLSYRRVGFQHESAAAIAVPATWGAKPLTPLDGTVFDASAGVTAEPAEVMLWPGESATVTVRRALPARRGTAAPRRRRPALPASSVRPLDDATRCARRAWPTRPPQVTFTLPPELEERRLFYSGYLTFLPQPVPAGAAAARAGAPPADDAAGIATPPAAGEGAPAQAAPDGTLAQAAPEGEGAADEAEASDGAPAAAPVGVAAVAAQAAPGHRAGLRALLQQEAAGAGGDEPAAGDGGAEPAVAEQIQSAPAGEGAAGAPLGEPQSLPELARDDGTASHAGDSGVIAVTRGNAVTRGSDDDNDDDDDDDDRRRHDRRDDRRDGRGWRSHDGPGGERPHPGDEHRRGRGEGLRDRRGRAWRAPVARGGRREAPAVAAPPPAAPAAPPARPAVAPLPPVGRVAGVRLVVPYQGAPGYSTSLPVAMPNSWRVRRRAGPPRRARPAPHPAHAAAAAARPAAASTDPRRRLLTPLTPAAVRASARGQVNALCYAPGTVNVLSHGVAVNPAMKVNDGGCAALSGSYGSALRPAIEVPLSQIQQFPCALSLVLAPILPVRRITVELTDPATNATLGGLGTLETASYSRSPAGSPWSYCLDWRGRYDRADGGGTAAVRPGRAYGMAATLEAPLSLADAAAGLAPRRVRVPMQGSFKVVRG